MWRQARAGKIAAYQSAEQMHVVAEGAGGLRFMIMFLMMMLFIISKAPAMRIAGPARVALETGGVITVLRNASEPPFRAQTAADRSSVAALPPLCVIVRTAGEGYTLRKPGYVLGLKGPGSRAMGPWAQAFKP